MNETRVYRFKHVLWKSPLLMGYEFRGPDGPVAIRADEGKLLGFATISDKPAYVVVSCAIDAECPERLDLELRELDFWLNMTLDLRTLMIDDKKTPSVAYVKGLVLTTQNLGSEARVDPAVGVLE